MKYNFSEKRPLGGRYNRLIHIAAWSALGCAAALAVPVPYYSNFTGTGDRGLTDWSTSSGTLTTEEFFGSGNGWYVTSNNGVNATVSLALSGLTAGVTYNVVFDWVTTGRWRGNNDNVNGNADTMTVTYEQPSSQTLLPLRSYSTDTTSGDNQTYRDNLGTSPTTVIAGTGADNSSTLGSNNAESQSDWAVYYFSRGSGNPSLSFQATATTGTLKFTIAGVGDSSARWDIGNVIVAVPEATSVFGLCFMAISAVGVTMFRNGRTFRSIDC